MVFNGRRSYIRLDVEASGDLTVGRVTPCNE